MKSKEGICFGCGRKRNIKKIKVCDCCSSRINRHRNKELRQRQIVENELKQSKKAKKENSK